MKVASKWFTVLIFAALLVACGGGDVEDSTDDTTIAIGVAVALTQTAVAQAPDAPNTEESVPPTPTMVTDAASVPTTAAEETAVDETVAEEMDVSAAIVDLQGVSIHYDEAAMGNAPSVAIVPRTPWSEGPGLGEGNPEMIQFKFSEDSYINIFAVDEYLSLFSPDYETVDALAALAAERPSTAVAPLPFLPNLPAAQIFNAQLSYVDFQGGAGIRYLTDYAQAIMPINPKYTFQGLTSDGKFYITAIFPVMTDAIPARTDAEFDALMSDMDEMTAYHEETIATLQGLSSQDFSPDLTVLDAMIASLIVAPIDFPSAGAPVSEIPDCVNDAEFVADVTFPDNSEIAFDSMFEKVWRFKNTGTCTWVWGPYSVRYDGGDAELLAESLNMNPGTVLPGEEAEFTIMFKAPYLAGSYVSWWQMVSPAQRPFGSRFYVLIDVPQTDENEPVSDAPGYGVIRGELSYPANAIPPQTVYFQDVNHSETMYSLQTGAEWDSYENELPAGEYYVFARVMDDPTGLGAGYTASVICGLTADCIDHSLLPVTIQEGRIIENIDVTDWYAPEGSFPFP